VKYPVSVLDPPEPEPEPTLGGGDDATMFAERRVESTTHYPNVLVTLDEAHLHSHTHRLRRRPGGSPAACPPEGEDDPEDVIKLDGEHEGTAMLEMAVPEYSIEGLRREVRKGKGEKWSAYECKFVPHGTVACEGMSGGLVSEREV
jgi:hypothetical protein